ncbi:MAG: hypothetical protein NT027_03000 [Proteobacteria bacterium]|nr:hypothetical protein [Pseudomonadota bacterium]
MNRQLPIEQSKDTVPPSINLGEHWPFNVDANEVEQLGLATPKNNYNGFLPDLNKTLGLKPNGSHFHLSLNQFFGLAVIKAFSEHESTLERSKSWMLPALTSELKSKKISDEIEEFYCDESAHSLMFEQFIVGFCDSSKTDHSILKKYLPSFPESSLATRILKFNALLGGSAAWWLVMHTEEESLKIYKMIKNTDSKIDESYLTLHKKHYEEEVTHMSVAPRIIRYIASNKSILSRIGRSTDFLAMLISQTLWVLQQCGRFNSIQSYQGTDQFMINVRKAWEESSGGNPIENFLAKTRLMFLALLFTSPLNSRSIRAEIKKNRPIFGSLSLKLYEFLSNRIYKNEGSAI